MYQQMLSYNNFYDDLMNYYNWYQLIFHRYIFSKRRLQPTKGDGVGNLRQRRRSLKSEEQEKRSTLLGIRRSNQSARVAFCFSAFFAAEFFGYYQE